MNDLAYYKSAVIRFRGLAKTCQPQHKQEMRQALSYARRKCAELEKDLFRKGTNEDINDRMLERILAAIKRLP